MTTTLPPPISHQGKVSTLVIETIKSQVLSLLEANRVTEPPIVAANLAKLLDFKVVRMVFGPKHARCVAGFIDVPKREIVVNAEDSPVQQNFTVAHELGHYVLEHYRDKNFEENYSVLLRNVCANGHSPMEIEANVFADHLLVPTMFLREYLDRYPYATDQELSRIFAVPAEVIRNRRIYV